MLTTLPEECRLKHQMQASDDLFNDLFNGLFNGLFDGLFNGLFYGLFNNLFNDLFGDLFNGLFKCGCQHHMFYTPTCVNWVLNNASNIQPTDR